MIFKFTAVVIPGAYVAQARVSPVLTVAQVLQALSIGGLEVATLLAMGDRLGACGLNPGDRLGIFPDEARTGGFPAPVHTGGREVICAFGDREVSSAGRPTLALGVPDPDTPLPDIDLRDAARSGRVNLLPGRCAALVFDGKVGQWFAALTGGARVLIDDYELTAQPIPLTAQHMLRFFTPLDDPAQQLPLAEVRVTVTTPPSPDMPRLPSGPLKLAVRFGSEVGPFSLRGSDSVRIGQIAAGLGKQTDIPLTEPAHVVRLRLAPPQMGVDKLLPSEFLYAARSPDL